jgi:hypothetical protein
MLDDRNRLPAVASPVFTIFRDRSADPGAWLARSHGFRVDSPEGRVGEVTSLRFYSGADRPDALVVRTGLFRRRDVEIPVDEIEVIAPRERRIFLRSRGEPTPTRSVLELLQRVLCFLAARFEVSLM